LIGARGYLEKDRTDAVFIPLFNAATIDGEERTVVWEQRSMPASTITAIPIKVPIATPGSSLTVDHKGGDR
jgi:hypothetical protein